MSGRAEPIDPIAALAAARTGPRAAAAAVSATGTRVVPAAATGTGTHLAPAAATDASPHAPGIERVLAHIDAHLAAPLPLAGLARLTGLSVWRFATVFRERVGLPPHRYISARRVRRAQALLAQGVPAAIVAGEAGFCDQSHLARSMKRVCNMTPRQFLAGRAARGA